MPPENVAVLAEVRRASPVPIATGERLVTRHGFREIFEKLACNVIQPDLHHCGGYGRLARSPLWLKSTGWVSRRIIRWGP